MILFQPTSSPTPAPTEPTAAPTVASPTATASISDLFFQIDLFYNLTTIFLSSQPTKAPTLPPSPAPTPSPTAFDQCSAYPNGGKCRKAPGCSWDGVRCFSDGAPTSPVAAPSAEPPVGGPNPNECIARGLSCDLGTCCKECQRNGRWANTCK